MISSDVCLSVLLITYNEEANIGRTLSSLSWVSSIVVVDSGSTDATLQILSGFPGVRLLHRSFDNFANQCNFGLGQVDSRWILSIDADYVITPALASHIQRSIAKGANDIEAFSIPFRYCVAGKPLRGTILPPRLALLRRGCGRYINDGHAHKLVVSGRTKMLLEPILHDDRKSLDRWLSAQQGYLRLEANKLSQTPFSQLSSVDRLRKYSPLAPFAIFFVCLVCKRGLLDGWRGWFYAFQRMYAEILLKLLLLDLSRVQSTPPSTGS